MGSSRRELRRRDFLRGGALAAAGLAAARGLAHAAPQHEGHPQHPPPPAPEPPPATSPAAGRLGYVPVETPDVPRLPWRWVDGAKEFHLRCEVVKQQFLPWREPFNLWGYNGSVPGPTIEVVEGDRLRRTRPSATATSGSRSRSGRSCPTTRRRTRSRWSSTG